MMAELYTVRYQSRHCRTTVVAALHFPAVIILPRRIDGADRVRQWFSRI